VHEKTKVIKTEASCKLKPGETAREPATPRSVTCSE
jgi:hypothetical protein